MRDGTFISILKCGKFENKFKRMDIFKSAELYLNTLYVKSRKNISGGYDPVIIFQLSGLRKDEAENALHYLEGKGFISQSDNKSDFNIYITAPGIDYIAKQKENKVYNYIRFVSAQYFQPGARAVIPYLFRYELEDENGIVSFKSIVVIISDQQGLNWGYQFWSYNPDEAYKNLVKILLQFAKEKIIEKLKENTLTEQEEMILLSTNSPITCPYIPEALPEVDQAEFEVEIGQNSIGIEIKENKLAASIIETRDIINTIFHEKYGEKLLLLNQERNLLDFFKSSVNEEEFSHRIASLAEVSRNLNVSILRKATNTSSSEQKSIQLLKLFYEQNSLDGKKITEVLVAIGRVRQGYPVHTDLAGIITALQYFAIPYPINDYDAAWSNILNQYLTALTYLKDTLINLFISKQANNTSQV